MNASFQRLNDSLVCQRFPEAVKRVLLRCFNFNCRNPGSESGDLCFREWLGSRSKRSMQGSDKSSQSSRKSCFFDVQSSRTTQVILFFAFNCHHKRRSRCNGTYEGLREKRDDKCKRKV